VAKTMLQGTTKWRWLLAVIVLGLVGLSGFIILDRSSSPPKAFDNRMFLRLSLEGFLRPGYGRLHNAAQEMETLVGSHCEGQSRDDQRLDQAFETLLAAWGRIEIIDFGPTAENNRQERLFFWPDRQQIGARQIQRLLAARDESVTRPETLAARSVAIQGLTALDRVLWPGVTGDDLEASRTYRCAFALAIAANIVGIARELMDAWSAGGAASEAWLNPGKANEPYLNSGEAVLAMTKALNRALDRTLPERVRLLGAVRPGRNEAALPGGRARRAHILIRANLEGVRRLFTEGGYQGTLMQAATRGGFPSMGPTVRVVEREFANGMAQLERMAARPISQEDGATIEEVGAIIQSLGISRRQIAAAVSLTSGLNLGFNFSDGD
jgi:predicted lipoprotein